MIGGAAAAVQGGPQQERLFAEMDACHRQPLYLWAISHSCDPGDAWDLIQDAFERALRCKPALADHTALRGWLLVVLRHLLIDRLRRAESRRRVDLDPSTLLGPENEVIADWRIVDVGSVDDLLLFVAPIHREAVRLQAVGWSIESIANHLGVRPATIGTRLFRARVQLRSALAGRFVASAAVEMTMGAEKSARSPSSVKKPDRRRPIPHQRKYHGATS